MRKNNKDNPIEAREKYKQRRRSTLAHNLADKLYRQRVKKSKKNTYNRNKLEDEDDY